MSRIAGILGELLITFGVIIALFVFYQLYWTGVSTGKAQAQAADDLLSQWDSAAPVDPAAPPPPAPRWIRRSAVMAEAFNCVPEGAVVPGVPGRHIVTPDQSQVVTPHGEASMVTFTTCRPQWSNTHRLIVHGVLAGVEAKAVA